MEKPMTTNPQHLLESIQQKWNTECAGSRRPTILFLSRTDEIELERLLGHEKVAADLHRRFGVEVRIIPGFFFQ
jgi:hypothetical protein